MAERATDGRDLRRSDAIRIANEFAFVHVRKVHTRNGERLEIESPRRAQLIRLDPLELESIACHDDESFLGSEVVGGMGRRQQHDERRAMAVTQLPESLPEVDPGGLGSKPRTTDYVLHHDGYQNHRRIFPARPGPEPTVTEGEPQEQLDQIGSAELWDELLRRAVALPGVSERDSAISVKGARAFWLDPELVKGPEDSLIIETEFAHIHPRPDSSWHLQLPHELALLAVSGGWGRIHTVVWVGDAPANSMMLYSPRNEEELEVIWALVEESYRYATGQPQELVIEPRIVGA
jgi:hypothetical protein